jgi:DNA uptake protein ComE-like DNA-binding protein
MEDTDMRRIATYVLAAGLVGVMAGCSLSSMEKKYDEMTKKETRVELNTANRQQLAALPGLTRDDAGRIMTNRPYDNRRDLVRKQVLTESQFDKIRDSVYVAHAKD